MTSTPARSRISSASRRTKAAPSPSNAFLPLPAACLADIRCALDDLRRWIDAYQFDGGFDMTDAEFALNIMGSSYSQIDLAFTEVGQGLRPEHF